MTKSISKPSRLVGKPIVRVDADGKVRGTHPLCQRHRLQRHPAWRRGARAGSARHPEGTDARPRCRLDRHHRHHGRRHPRRKHRPHARPHHAAAGGHRRRNPLSRRTRRRRRGQDLGVGRRGRETHPHRCRRTPGSADAAGGDPNFQSHAREVRLDAEPVHRQGRPRPGVRRSRRNHRGGILGRPPGTVVS